MSLWSRVSARVVAGAVAVAVGAAGCGSGDDGGDTSRDVAVGAPADTGAWAEQVLEAAPNPDSPVLVAADRSTVLAVVVGEDGAITSFAADGDAELQVGEPIPGHGFTLLGGVTPTGDGWLLVTSGGLGADGTGNQQLSFELRAYRSDDGLRWTEIETTGLDGPADVTGVARTSSGVVAVGSLRTSDDPGTGGFRPVAWHSPDGKRWTATDLTPPGGASGGPTGLDVGFVRSVAVTGDTVVAVGHASGRSTVWRSDDGGRTWSAQAAGEVGAGDATGADPGVSIGHLAAEGDVLVLSGASPGRDEGSFPQSVWRSSDGGRSWREATDPPSLGSNEGILPSVFAGGGRFFLLSHTFVHAFSQAETCYADIELCRQDSSVTLYASDDGDAWSRVDTSGVGAAPGDKGDTGEFDAVAATDGGRVVGVKHGSDSVGTWSWPAGVELPTAADPDDPTPTVEVLGGDDPLVLGERSALPLYIHCGMDWLYADGDDWRRTDGGPDVETGAGDTVSPDWPVAQQTIFGYVTLLDDDRIEYSIGKGDDSEVIATYERSDASPPGCE